MLNSEEKNKILRNIKASILKNKNLILEANKLDMENAKKNNLKDAFLDRLFLGEDRVIAMANSIDIVINLDDPIGKMSEFNTMKNGLMIGRKTVPIGVLAIIYEARPNVTLDASILALKSSNALILRGGKEAINSNKAISEAIREGISNSGHNSDMIKLIEDTSRESARLLMELRNYVDLLIPRGSASLINSVVENAKVPTLETGVGNCHIYVDENCDIDMAINIIKNAKTSRISVCNAMESLLVSKKVKEEFFTKLQNIIDEFNITVYGCEKTNSILKNAKIATDEDFYTEYLDYAMSMKIVNDIDEAIDHIYKYSSGHSETIVTEDYTNALKFLNEVDSSCVYVNASTRFSDGGEFGFGAELGISTQKLHARGPVGINELTSYKYIIFGQGQIR